MMQGDSKELKLVDLFIYYGKVDEHKTIFEFFVDNLNAVHADHESKGCSYITGETSVSYAI